MEAASKYPFLARLRTAPRSSKLASAAILWLFSLPAHRDAQVVVSKYPDHGDTVVAVVTTQS